MKFFGQGVTEMRHIQGYFGRLLPVGLIIAMGGTLLAATPEARSVRPDPSKPPTFAVYPPEISLDSERDFQSFIAVLTREDGVTLDISDRVEWSLSGDAVAKIDGHVLHPAADGKAELIASYLGVTHKIPVAVQNASTSFPISFE